MALKRTRWNPRKLLIASAGVATVNHAAATGCGLAEHGGRARGDGVGGAPVANLVAPPSYAGASVANLVVPPPAGSGNLPDAAAPASPTDGGAEAGPLDAAADNANG
jgi:hypothetical protein